MADYEIVIRNGMVVDGSGLPPFRADVGIRDGRIAKITGRLRGAGARELDATGLVVAPGAVDLHTHYDAQVTWDPWCSLSGWHGVTTVTIGQCGFGFAPCREEDREAMMRMMSRIEAIPLRALEAGLPWDWVTYPEYLDGLARRGLGVNVASLLPFTPLRSWVIGADAARERTSLTGDERERMKALAAEAMAAGAFGFAADRDPIDRPEDGGWLPSHVASDEEFLDLADVLADHGVGHVGWTIGVGLDERGRDPLLEAIAARSGRPVHFDGVAPIAYRGEGWRDQLAWLEDVNRRGLPMYGQAICTETDSVFTLAEFNMFDDLPRWVEPLVGGAEARARKLAMPEHRAAMKLDLEECGSCRFHKDWRKVRVVHAAGEANRELEGLSVAEIAGRRGVHPLDAFLDVALEEGLQTEFAIEDFVNSGDLPAMEEILTHPFIHFSVSDGGAHVRYLTVSTWPTWFLSFWVRDRGLMDLGRAHYRMSALPAWFAGIRDRGVLREGMAADVMVYDLEALRLTPERPVFASDFPAGERRLVQRAEGYRYILVNGRVTFEDGECTGDLPGRLLRSCDRVG